MDSTRLKELVQNIIRQAKDLQDKYIAESDAPVNYACVFAQSETEYEELNKAARMIGKVIKEMNSGLLYHIADLETVVGTLKLLKIRLPDATRPELGDADFTMADFSDSKQRYLMKTGFQLIPRPGFEMVELKDDEFKVRAYFSNPSLDKLLKV